MELSSREGSRNSSNSRNNLCHATLSDSNIRNNAENFKSLSKRRKYAMRSNGKMILFVIMLNYIPVDGNSQDRCCSPRSIQAEANIHPYTHCFNNKYIHEIRSVEYEDNKGISHEIKYRAVAQREPFSSTKHKIANNYLSYNSRDSETYKSNSGWISDYNSRSSSKNRRYFSFKEGGMVQSLSPKSNFYNSAPKFYQPENTLTRGFETADNKNIQKVKLLQIWAYKSSFTLTSDRRFLKYKNSFYTILLFFPSFKLKFNIFKFSLTIYFL